MKLGSLFDGIGGWLIAASRAGITPVWSSEIEKFPRAVTAYHFPDVKQLGDITKIDGAAIEPVDIITLGSPCQDLSVAGKRAGLAGERSGLFVRAVKLIRQMRNATNGKYPRYAVWENVPGAYTSNKGMDFKAVLEAFTEAEIPMPDSGRWAKAGMVRGGKCCAVWRTLDAQYWGVPQRRERIFLVADYTGWGGTEEILFKPESMCRNTHTSGTKRENAAESVGGRTTQPDETYCIRNSIIDRESQNGGNLLGIKEECAYNLDTAGPHAVATLRMRGGKPGGGKGPLISENKSLTLGTSNDQTLFYQKTVNALQASDYKGIGNQYVEEKKLIVESCLNDQGGDVMNVSSKAGTLRADMGGASTDNR